MQEINTPFMKLTKKNEQIYLNVSPDMDISDVALGVFTYCELVAQQNRVDTETVVNLISTVLSDILTHSKNSPILKPSAE